MACRRAVAYAALVLLVAGVPAARAAGVVRRFRTPDSGAGPVGITAGPDGALWFTESFANRIGRITTNGVISEFPLPVAGSAPVAITRGPDGALWFTETSTTRSAIGR